MALEIQNVQHIARLARLALSTEDQNRYATQLGNILDLAAQLSAVDTTGVLPMAHPQDAHQRLRPDVVSEPNLRDSFQAIAPDTAAGFYRVPKVIE